MGPGSGKRRKQDSARAAERPASLVALAVPNATVFVSSFCIMVIELVAGRIIARHLGSSLYTWTSVIGIVLAGIAVGNYVGGRLADRFAARRTLVVLFIVASGTSATISAFNNIVSEMTFLWTLSWQMRVASHVALVFFLPSCMLGMISPVVAKMALDLGYRTGQTIGGVYAWGVVGSIIGTFVTGFFLVDRFGTTKIIWSVAGVLAVMAIIYGLRSWKTWTWAGVLAFFAVLATGSWSWAQDYGEKLWLRRPARSNVLYSDESQYSYIEVIQLSEDPDIRHMHLDTLLHSKLKLESPGNLDYQYEQVYAAITHRASRGKQHVHSLMIGGGGYVFPRYMDAVWPGSRTDVVEIDPAVTKAAMEAFGLAKDTPIKCYHEDGRVFVDRLAKKVNAGEPTALYDFVYFDAVNDYSVPYQLTTREFMQNVATLLTPEGGCLINMIDIYDSGLLLGSLMNTVKTVFPNVYVLVEGSPSSESLEIRNTFVIACFQRELDVEDLGAECDPHIEIFALTDAEMAELKEKSRQLVLTDDYAPVENLLAPVVKEAALDKAVSELASRAQLAGAAEKYDEAIDICEEGLRLFPDQVLLLSKLGLAQFSTGRVQDALKTLTRAVRLQPDYVLAQRTLVDCYLELGENEKALPHFRAILKYSPADQTTRLEFGKTLAKLRRYEESIEQFTALKGKRPNFSKAYNSWAYELYQQGDLEGAIEKYKRAVEADPAFAEPRLNLAKLFLSNKRYEEAIGAYRAYLELNPDDADALMNLGNAWLDSGRPVEAAAAYARVVELEPTNPTAHFNLGRAYAAQNRFTEAERAYRKSRQFSPDDVDNKKH